MCPDIPLPLFTSEALGPSHMVGAVLAVASLVIMIGACVLNMMCLHRRLIAIMASLIALTFTSGKPTRGTLTVCVWTRTVNLFCTPVNGSSKTCVFV